MLWFKRKPEQRIRIGDDITILIGQTHLGHTKIGIEAPRHVRVDREEVFQARRAVAAEMNTLAAAPVPPPTDGGK